MREAYSKFVLIYNVKAKRSLWGAKCFYCTGYMCMFAGHGNGPHIKGGSDTSSRSKCFSFAPLNRQMNVKMLRLKLVFYEQTMVKSGCERKRRQDFLYYFKELKDRDLIDSRLYPYICEMLIFLSFFSYFHFLFFFC